MESPVPVVRFPDGAAVETARYCVNCKWYVQQKVGSPTCDHPNSYTTGIDLVSGVRQIKQRWAYCNVQRMHGASEEVCGKEGSWFEPREQAEAAE